MKDMENSLMEVAVRIRELREILGFTTAAMAEKKAVLSAQFVGVNEAFSMLQPRYIFPLLASKAAPTEKFEYLQ